MLANFQEENAFERAIDQANHGKSSQQTQPTPQSTNTVFYFGGGRFEVTDNGVFFVGVDDDGADKKALFICSRLDVIGLTSGCDGFNWGRMVEFTDRKGRINRLPIPARAWQGDGLALREMLSDRGLDIFSNGTSRRMMMDYIANAPAPTQFESVDKLGWHNGAFIMPNKAICTSETEKLIYQSTNQPPLFAEANNLEEWRDQVAHYAKGNSRLLFAVSVAFASSLMYLAGFRTSTGFHIRGSSSSGKSTALEMACSVWGKPESFMKTWRNTANALEGTALAHNDCLLALDELSMINPKELESVSYMLGNGQKKGRATISGNAKPVDTWRLLYLSNGEESLSGMLAKAGIRTNAGQEMRFIDIEADAGKGLGAFDDLCGLADGGTLSNTIKANCANHHGTAGIAWLTYLVENHDQLKGKINALLTDFVSKMINDKATAQHQRVCRYFALVAVAGEMATLAGITGWQQRESFQACKTLYLNWLEGFGTGNKEEQNILDHVRGFIEAHGASRFENINSDGNERIINRVGFIRHNETDGVEYLILPTMFKTELCKGFDQKQVIKVLHDAGILIFSKDGKSQLSVRTPEGQKRLHVISCEKLFR